MIGKTLAHYEITGLLGKGGMGEVFRGPYLQYRWHRQYEVHPDGEHFIMIENSNHLHFVSALSSRRLALPPANSQEIQK